jgi:hypothetical protein
MKVLKIALGPVLMLLLQGCASLPTATTASNLDVLDRASREHFAGSNAQGECPETFVKICFASISGPDAMTCGCSAEDQYRSQFGTLFR